MRYELNRFPKLLARIEGTAPISSPAELTASSFATFRQKIPWEKSTCTPPSAPSGDSSAGRRARSRTPPVSGDYRPDSRLTGAASLESSS